MSHLHAKINTEIFFDILCNAPFLEHSTGTAKLDISDSELVFTFIGDNEDNELIGRIIFPKSTFDVYSFRTGNETETSSSFYFNAATLILYLQFGQSSSSFSLFVDCRRGHEAFQLLYYRGGTQFLRSLMLEPVMPFLQHAFPLSNALTVDFPVKSIMSYLELSATSGVPVFFYVCSARVNVECGDFFRQTLVCGPEGDVQVFGLNLVDRIWLSMDLRPDDPEMMSLAEVGGKVQAAQMRLALSRALILSLHFETCCVEYAFRRGKAMAVCPFQKLL